MLRISKLLNVALAAAAFAGFGAIANAQSIRVQLNGEPVDFYGTQPREVDGRVMVPLRGVLEKMGATVDWNAGTQTVFASKNGLEIELPIGSRTAKVNDRSVPLDVPAMTMGGSTMVPLRFVSEALGADVAWHGTNRTVMIETDGRIARNDSEIYRGRDRNSNPDRNRRYSRSATISAGTVIPVTLDDSIKSNEAREGDRFTATVQTGRDDAGLPNGTKFEGVVTEAIASRNNKPGVLAVDFRRITFPDGTSKSIQAHVVGMDEKSITRDSNGRLIAKGGSNNDQMKWVGIGAGAGLLISTLTKGNVLLDTILGGGAGYLYNQLQHKGAGNVNLKSGSEVGVKFDQSITFAREPQ